MRYLVVLMLIALGTGCAGPGGTEPDTAAGTEAARSTPGDATITSAVEAAFREDAKLAPANIDVTTEQGVVTLNGRVPDAFVALQAISKAREVPGVRRIISQLEY